MTDKATPAKVRLTDGLGLEPTQIDGATTCVVRWMLETPGGWLGAHDRAAFDAYAATLDVWQRDCRTCLNFRGGLHCESLIACDNASEYKATRIVRLWDRRA